MKHVAGTYALALPCDISASTYKRDVRRNNICGVASRQPVLARRLLPTCHLPFRGTLRAPHRRNPWAGSQRRDTFLYACNCHLVALTRKSTCAGSCRLRHTHRHHGGRRNSTKRIAFGRFTQQHACGFSMAQRPGRAGLPAGRAHAAAHGHERRGRFEPQFLNEDIGSLKLDVGAEERQHQRGSTPANPTYLPAPGDGSTARRRRPCGSPDSELRRATPPPGFHPHLFPRAA